MKKEKVSNNFGKWGWSTIIYCMLAYYISDMIGNCGLNIYTALFPELRGWSASQILYLFSIASWIAVIGVIIFSHIGRKTSSRTVALITYIVLGVSLIVFARTTSWVVFSICAIIGVVLAMAVCGVVVPHNLMNKWFPTRKGLALGWATMGMPLCSATYPALMQLGIAKISFETTFTLIGSLVAVLGIVSLAWCKNYPEEVGAYPDNIKISEEEMKENIEKERNHVSNWKISELFKTSTVWTIGIGYGLVWMGIVGIVSQLIPRMISIGFGQAQATMYFSIVSIIGIVGSYLWGVLDQWAGTKKASLIYGCWWIITYIFLIFGSKGSSIIACVLSGIGIGGIGNLVPSMQGSMFGRYDFLTANRIIAPINMIIRTFAMTIIGYCLSHGLGYTGAYIMMVITVAIGTICIAFIKEPKKKGGGHGY